MSEAQKSDDLNKQLAACDAKIELLREGLKECEARTELIRSKIRELETLRARVVELLQKAGLRGVS